MEQLEKSKVYDLLVEDPEDIEALVAYSLYKRHKRLWAAGFRNEHDREPSHQDDIAFAKSCSTPDQLGRYRADARDILLSFADSIVEANKPQIEADIIATKMAESIKTLDRRSNFWRNTSSSVVVNVVSILILLGLTLAASLFGVDPLDGLKALNGPSQ